MNSGLATLCVGSVVFLLWVLTGLVKEWIGTMRRGAHSQEMVPYPMHKKQQVVIAIDLHGHTRRTGVAATIGQHQVTLGDGEKCASVAVTK